MRSRLAAICLIALAGFAVQTAAAEQPRVTFAQQPDQVRVEIDGRPFATYVYRDAKVLRPYIKDVHAPNGAQVTRNYPPIEGTDATDHADMHPGVWLAFGNVDGEDFWRNKGRVEHVEFVKQPAAEYNAGEFVVKNRYLAGDRLICNETCRIAIWALPEQTILLWGSQFSAPEEFYFGDQEEMGLGVRVATPLAVNNGGSLTSSDGLHGEQEIWGRQADWCDASGTIDGQRVGVLLVPDPLNFRRSWFHARDYGLLVANPFGRKAFTKSEEPNETIVPSGETFQLRFAVVIHSGDIELGRAASNAVTELNATRP